MSNLKARVKAIQEKLALSTAETVAQLADVQAEMRAGFERLQKEMDANFTHVHKVLATQAETQKVALDELLTLIAEQDDKISDHEARLQRLEKSA